MPKHKEWTRLGMQTQPHNDGLDDGLDLGPRRIARGSERLCAATGEVTPVADMIRFVVAPDGSVVPDLKRRLPGRGIWITATRPALCSALARKAFARSFKREVRVAGDLVESTERLLERAALDALAMAHKARRAVIGFAKVEAALGRAERVAALIQGSDAGQDGVRKLNASLRQRPDAENIVIVNTFAISQLDLAFGRANVVHAVLVAGPETEAFLARVARLERFRTGTTHRSEMS
jgi:predicted RNA-binding protein YlxR (DUF448 family)